MVIPERISKRLVIPGGMPHGLSVAYDISGEYATLLEDLCTYFIGVEGSGMLSNSFIHQ